jgi:hypothetical protein
MRACKNRHDFIEEEVLGAVQNVCNAPLDALEIAGCGLLPQDKGSSLIFVRHPVGDTDLERSIAFIPTRHLTQIFERHCCKVANQGCIKFFGPNPIVPHLNLMAHVLTVTDVSQRGADSWQLDQMMAL